MPVSLVGLLLWLLHSLGYTPRDPLAVECVYQDIPPTALNMVFWTPVKFQILVSRETWNLSSCEMLSKSPWACQRSGSHPCPLPGVQWPTHLCLTIASLLQGASYHSEEFLEFRVYLCFSALSIVNTSSQVPCCLTHPRSYRLPRRQNKFCMIGESYTPGATEVSIFH